MRKVACMRSTSPATFLAPLIEQPLVVEARLLGRRVIGLRVGRQGRGVLLQVAVCASR